MTLHVQTEFSIPEETIRVARAAYSHGNILMKLRDELGTIYRIRHSPRFFLTMADLLRLPGVWP